MTNVLQMDEAEAHLGRLDRAASPFMSEGSSICCLPCEFALSPSSFGSSVEECVAGWRYFIANEGDGAGSAETVLVIIVYMDCSRIG